ncbi:7-cyano-7-deazaguanine synthase [Mesorhizobium sp.]|uniref:7-cyano-7-deazaguanine synthase n=1 Tax=Mesorhizobium sp. TaxID=1871066 RepID=UPI00257BD4AE|nr:7-cyano-7-deazaguanine synthase [Mesorhizobium sp.]
MNTVACEYVRTPSKRSDTLTFDLAQLHWDLHGPLPKIELKPAALDLIEVSRIVHEIDRSMPRRISTERTALFEVTMPVRKPAVWKRAAEALSSVLYIQGGSEWKFTFTDRGADKTELDTLYATHDEARLASKPPRQVILFSGGLDSTSGLATLRGRQDEFVLVGAFSRNLILQQEIAGTLGFRHHIQMQGTWRGRGAAKVGGQFQHRSFYYLSLGAAFLSALGGDTLYQFENGPLALSVPPAPLYRMTRHAHPTVHRAAERLFEAVLGKKIAIINPFLKLTKRQALASLQVAEAKLIAKTETCWNIRATTVVGAGTKSSKTPCGTCIPCIVRQAATGVRRGEYAVNLAAKSGPYAKNDVVRVHLDAYLAFARRVVAPTYGFGNLLLDMPEVTEAAIFEHNAIMPDETLALYKCFSAELIEMFG